MVWFTLIFLVSGIVFPIVDRFWDKRIKQDMEKHNKMKTYSLIMLYQWFIVGCIVVGFLIMNISMTELGFVAASGNLSSFTGFLLGVMLNLVLLFIISLFVPFLRKKIVSLFDAIELLLPNGWKERLMFAAVAITAGFCEEVIYRGFMFYYFDRLGWGLSPLSIAIITSVLFGLAHFYQGWKNVIATGLVGFAMARFYMQYDSLWIPIALHIIIDLRFAIMPNLKRILIKLGKVPA